MVFHDYNCLAIKAKEIALLIDRNKQDEALKIINNNLSSSCNISFIESVQNSIKSWAKIAGITAVGILLLEGSIGLGFIASPLLLMGNWLYNRPDENTLSHLISMAVAKNDTHLLESLLNAGIAIEDKKCVYNQATQTHEGYISCIDHNILNFAIIQNNSVIINKLLQKGAKPLYNNDNKVTNDIDTDTLKLVIRKNQSDVLALLLKHNIVANEHHVAECVKTNNVSICQMFQGLPIIFTTFTDDILFKAVANHSSEVITLYKEAGYDFSKQQFLCKANSKHMIDLLLQYGTDINMPCRNSEMRTPLQHMLYQNTATSLELTHHLLLKGASLSHINEYDGSTIAKAS